MPLHLARDDGPGWVRARLAGRSGTRWVGVDGFGAAGKTTLAVAIAAAVPGSVVVPVDDFARAGVRGWERDRFLASVLEPLRNGRPGRYQRWDFARDVAAEWHVVPVGVPVIVEGVSATDARLGIDWDVSLWVDAPYAVRRARALLRDGPGWQDRWLNDWVPSEEAYAAEQRPQDRVDAIVDGAL